MSFVSRLASVKPPPGHVTARRAYSIFSKPGSGRFFTSAKPPKALARSSNPGSSTNSNPESTLKSQESSSESNPTSPNGAKEPVELEAHDSNRDGTRQAASSASTEDVADIDTSSQSTAAPSALPGLGQSPPATLFAEEGSMHHPRPPQDQLLLHSFFSLHRPLLLLPMHAQQPLFNIISTTGTIFDGVNTSNSASTGQIKEADDTGNVENGMPPLEVDMGSGKPLISHDGHSIQVQIGEDDIPEADADAARLLGRSYVVNRIGSFVDWQGVLKTLGDSQARSEIDAIQAAADETVIDMSDPEIRMDSVKRKRRKKMNKHIYKKRRKRERAQRRRLGK